jgi:hypothetical protein
MLIDIHSLDLREHSRERDSNWHQNSLFEQSIFLSCFSTHPADEVADALLWTVAEIGRLFGDQRRTLADGSNPSGSANVHHRSPALAPCLKKLNR